MERVRVRIGPSPTGEPHVGTAWITLFNLAFARKNGGKLVLRIEDTDRERSRPEWEREIIEGLRWLGLSWDEGPDVGGPFGPYRQSERRAIHEAHAHQLVDEGHAYRCFCSKERLDALREAQRAAKGPLGYDRHCRELPQGQIEENVRAGVPFTVRMKMPKEGETLVADRLRGTVRFPNANVDDQILLKSDGYPTYHLANVVDDHLMEISHVIRAEEWISSTPKHVILYRMFGWTPPVFVHLPLLRNKDTSKISKRKNPVSILDYRQRGYLPEALLNFLGLLGFSMPDEREVFDLDAFIEAFDLDRVSLTGPVFDLEKLTWLNGKYLRERLTDDQLADLIHGEILSRRTIRAIVPLIRERIDVGEQFIAAADYFFRGDIPVEVEHLSPKGRSGPELRIALEACAEALEGEVDFSPRSLEIRLRGIAEKLEWPTGDLFKMLRVAATGRTASPPLFETLSVLGRALVRRRLRTAATLVASASRQRSTTDAPDASPKSPPRDGAPGEPQPKEAEAGESKVHARTERRTILEALRAAGSLEGAARSLAVEVEALEARISQYRVKDAEWTPRPVNG